MEICPNYTFSYPLLTAEFELSPDDNVNKVLRFPKGRMVHGRHLSWSRVGLINAAGMSVWHNPALSLKAMSTCPQLGSLWLGPFDVDSLKELFGGLLIWSEANAEN